MAANFNDTDAFILSAVRTPLGGFLGSLSSFSAVELGVHAVKGALARSGVHGNEVDELLFGNVIQAGNRQNPARQVAVHAGLPNEVPATTVNKVCASGLKAVALAAQTIRLGEAHTVIAGGTESMSNAPHLLPKVRTGIKYGSAEILDSAANDGLTDAFGGYAMGVAAEKTVAEFSITREQQDDYAAESYVRAQQATKEGLFAEIVPVEVPGARGKPGKVVSSDDEQANFMPEKMRTLRPAFDPKGSVTAANSSPMSDGAAALVLVSGKRLRELVAAGRIASGATVFKVLASADAEQVPEKFTTTPAKALPKALQRAGLSLDQVDYVECNEAFACVALANMQLLGLSADKCNVFGGAVALGHPLGASGARILTTLCSVLINKGGRVGAAAICNGGGGASACVIERIVLGSVPAAQL